MKKALIIYSTIDGQTKNICTKLREYSGKKNSIDLFSINETEKIDLLSYKKIVLGASIRYGKHNQKVFDFVRNMESSGAGEILLTSMDRDGTKKGYDLDLTKKVSNIVNIPVIASGGVGTLEHLHQGFKIGNASAVLAASIFHFGEHSILDVKQYLDSKGIPVRI